MTQSNNILLIGNCGSGKTWVMRQLLNHEAQYVKLGLIRGMLYKNLLVLGVYDGSTFEGSDKLSMAVAREFELLYVFAQENRLTVVAEGDRFTNKKYLSIMKPYIIKITDDGAEGRLKRRSKQTFRHIQAISTRVRNTPFDEEVVDSKMALQVIIKKIKEISW